MTDMDCRDQLAAMAAEEYDKGDFVYAIKLLNMNLNLAPNNHELYFERSVCHYKLGNYQASLNDANAAIRLNMTDYTIHYQKGLALSGLSKSEVAISKREDAISKSEDAIKSFKKAIELRAKQEHSKLSDIFKLLRDAMREVDAVRRRLNQQTLAGGTPTLIQTSQHPQAVNSITTAGHALASNNDPVDSTTDRPLTAQQTPPTKPESNQLHVPGPTASMQNHHHNHNNNLIHHQRQNSSVNSIESFIKNGSNSLVANDRNSNINMNSNPGNNQLISSPNLAGTSFSTNRVPTIISYPNNQTLNSISSSDISNTNTGAAGSASDALRNPDPNEDPKSAQYDWSIRRSERIFLHANEPGGSIPHIGVLKSGPLNQRPKTGSNPSSIDSGRGPTKRPHETSEPQNAYQPSRGTRSRDGASSHAESEVDVDDSYRATMPTAAPDISDSSNARKRIVIAPSSSMPATSQRPANATSKDDSYSSKWKRLRRDRERARRGTSKLCTIKSSDLDELQKLSSSDSSQKRFMRVIAPIDGWLYSGQLSLDETPSRDGKPQYVVKLDGDATGSSYLFNQEQVLNDVIKEVRVNSVSELRKGARICCYWSRQYKCLSTGVVTSRTFEATKSLVSVKYDNGDLSALPLEDLRLLPPDYPKYMSNCDPLLLARNGDGAHATAATTSNVNQTGNRIMVENHQASTNHGQQAEPRQSGGPTQPSTSCEMVADDHQFRPADVMAGEKGPNRSGVVVKTVETAEDKREELMETDRNDEQQQRIENGADQEEDEDATIPPTDETIDFITNDDSSPEQQESDQQTVDGTQERVDQIPTTKDSMTITNETQLSTTLATAASRASSEENNYGIEYRPWLFDGPPRRSKRHGRAYRDNYSFIRRGSEVIRVGDSAELMPRDESILPFIAKIDGFWATLRGEMKVRVRWYYRLAETEGEPYELKDGDNALFETDHFDENDVQSIYRSTEILSWTEYSKNHPGHSNDSADNKPKIFYLAGYYDPVRRVKHLRSDVKESQ